MLRPAWHPNPKAVKRPITHLDMKPWEPTCLSEPRVQRHLYSSTSPIQQVGCFLHPVQHLAALKLSGLQTVRGIATLSLSLSHTHALTWQMLEMLKPIWTESFDLGVQACSKWLCWILGRGPRQADTGLRYLKYIHLQCQFWAQDTCPCNFTQSPHDSPVPNPKSPGQGWHALARIP